MVAEIFDSNYQNGKLETKIEEQYVEPVSERMTFGEVKKIIEETSRGKKLLQDLEQEIKEIIEDTKREKEALERFEKKAKKILNDRDSITEP